MMPRRVAFAPHAQYDLPILGLAVLVSLFLWSLAYQIFVPFHLSVGGDSAAGRREDDAPYLTGFNASEPAVAGRYDWWALDNGNTYRWATSTAKITLPGVGGGPWLFSLTASSGRPDGAAVASVWQNEPGKPVSLPIAASPRVYHILVASDVAGDASVQMQTPAYASVADSRDLGFVLHDVHVLPVMLTLRQPALTQLGWLSLSLGLLYLFARWSGFTLGQALVVISTYVFLTAILLATQRFALTLFTPALTGLLLCCVVLTFAISQAMQRLVPGWFTQRDRQRLFKHVVVLVLLAFAVRMGGMLHPHAIFSDHRLHANNLLELALGSVYFSEGLPAEAGGGQAPYPPAVYLLLLPLLLVTPLDMSSRVLIMQSGVALLDSLIVAGIWGLLAYAGRGRRVALLGALLYLLPAPMLVSFSIGEYANIGGQALAMPAIGWLGVAGAFLVGSFYRTSAGLEHIKTKRRESSWMWLWVALLSMGVLGHLGIALSMGMLLLAVWLVGAWEHMHQRRTNTLLCRSFSLRAITLGTLIAGTVVAGLYYSAPTFHRFFAQRLTGESSGGAELDISRSAELVRLLQTVFAPYQRLMPVLVIAGVVGVMLLRQSCQTTHAQRTRNVSLVLIAWWLGTLLAISLPLWLGAGQGVRWPHFLYPALCLGAGASLAAFWRRGYAGSLVALASLATILAYGLIIWIEQVRDYLH